MKPLLPRLPRIISKHWKPYYTSSSIRNNNFQPFFAYCQTHDIKKLIAPRQLKKQIKICPDSGNPFGNFLGMFQCRKIKCLTCRFVPRGKKSFHAKSKTNSTWKFYIYCTDFAIYSDWLIMVPVSPLGGLVPVMLPPFVWWGLADVPCG